MTFNTTYSPSHIALFCIRCFYTNDLLLINTEDFGGSITEIRIQSLEGRLVLKVPVENGLTQSALDLTGIRGGSYMVSLINEQGAILKTLPLLKND